MASYQELETRILVLEDRIKFMFASMQMSSKSPITGELKSVSLDQLYQEAKERHAVEG